MSTAVSTQTNGGAMTASERIEATLANMVDKFRAVLPAEMPAERFCRVAQTALQDPRVQEVAYTHEGRQSIIVEVTAAATDGLLLDKREAFLNVYKTKIKTERGEEWVPLAKYMPMYRGLMKLARNSGVIADIKCDTVKGGDVFAVDKFPPPGECPITHKYPENAFARGDVMGVYAVALYKDGTWSNAEVMSYADVEKIRQASPGKDKDAWGKHWNEMARKTVIRRLSKYLPNSTDGMERLHNASQRGDDYNLIEGVASAGALAAPERKKPMAKALLTPPSPPAPPAPPAEPQKEAAPAKPAAKAKTESKPKSKPAETPQVPIEDEGYDDRGGGDWPDEDDNGV
jgi:recombination protein RecT